MFSLDVNELLGLSQSLKKSPGVLCVHSMCPESSGSVRKIRMHSEDGGGQNFPYTAGFFFKDLLLLAVL